MFLHAKIKENFIHFYRAQFYRKNAKLVIDYIRLNYSLQHLIENSSQYNDRKYSTYLIYKAYGLYIIDKYSSETINIQEMCDLVNSRDNVFEKALLLLVLISYLQAFNDGNKRTARIISNAILMEFGYCPLSYRSVKASDYKKAMLLYDERN